MQEQQEQEQEQQQLKLKKRDKEEGIINLPIRLKDEEYAVITSAAEEANMRVSTWIREVALAVAGDNRTLTVLLKAVSARIKLLK